MGVTFARPPVNEVVAGLVFVPRTGLLIPHIGEFWATRLKGQYPGTAHVAPIALPGELPVFDQTTGAPLPRLWFVGEDESRLIQLQQDRLYANWRQRREGEPYIRYPAIRDEVVRVLSLLDEYLKEIGQEPVRPTRYELTYVNALRKGLEYNDSAGLGTIMRDVVWESSPNRFLAPPSKVGARFEFALPGEMGTLSVTADPARNNKSQQELFRLQLAAIAPIDVVARISLVDWLEIAHEQIVRGFKDLTTPRMHEIWGLFDEEGQ